MKPNLPRDPNTSEAVRACRSVLLGWTDEVTGERLTVHVRGSQEFVENLEPLGFEHLAAPGEPEAEGEAEDGPRPGPSRWSGGSARAEGSGPSLATGTAGSGPQGVETLPARPKSA